MRSVNTRIPGNVTATIFHGTVTLSGVTDEMEISYDNGKTYTSEITYTYAEKGEKNVLVRFKTTTDYLAGDDLKLKVIYNDFAGGSGTEADPYLIEDYQQLISINKDGRAKDVYKLMADIRFPEIPVTKIIAFSGTFLGNNKKLISPRLDYSNTTSFNNYGGIFYTNGSDTRIRDLSVEDAEIITAPSQMTHGLLINEAKEISNCKVSGKLILSCTKSHGYSVGGLCGQINDNGSIITNCSASVTIEISGEEASSYCFGGLVGEINSGCVIENSNADITASSGSITFYNGYAGGLVGSVETAESVTVSQSWANTNLNVSAINCFVGGIVALAPYTDITNCYSIGEIVANGNSINPQSKCVVGGITAGVKGNSPMTGNVINCYSAVDITVDKDDSAIIASGIICNAIGTADKKIENCLCVGKITVLGSGSKTAIINAIVFNASAYTIENNYVSAASFEGIELDNVTVVAEEDYLTATWLSATLKFDEAIWVITDGKLPELHSVK